MKYLYYVIFILITISCSEETRTNSDSKIKDETVSQKKINAMIFPPMSEKEPGKIENISLGCGYNYKLSETEIEIFTPQHREIDEIEKILSYSGIPLNFEIYSAEIENAVATIIDNNRYIIYDPRLLESTDNSSSYWSSMSILAHEIGHHLSGHTLNNLVGSHQAELEADKFSGFVLYKMGATIEQAIYAISLYGGEFDSESHPNKERRILAIKKGWEEASRLRYEGALPPPPLDIPIAETYEYTKEMLWNEEILSNQRRYYEYDDDFFTGIISDIENRSDGSFGLEIYITETGNSWRTSVGNLDKEKIWVIIDRPVNGMEMAKVPLEWLLVILNPGRKIRFAFIEEGSGSFKTISYIKALPSR